MKIISTFAFVILNIALLFSQNTISKSSNSPGEILWYKTVYGSPAPFRVSNPVLTPEGDIIWVNYKKAGIPYTDVVCLSPEGDTVWIKNFVERFELDPMVVPQLGWILLISETASNKLFCLNPDGTERWSLVLENVITGSPVTDTSYNFYFVAGSKLYAVDSSGTVLWQYDSPAGNISTPLSISRSGVIYFGTEFDNLIAVQNTGNTIFNNELFGYVRGASSIDLDGTIFMSTSDINVNQSKIEVFTPSGDLKWDMTFDEPNPSAVAIGDSNFIYIRTLNFWGGGFGKLYKIDKTTQEIEWAYNYGPGFSGAWDLSLADDGTIYMVIGGGTPESAGRYLAINQDGTLKWQLNPATTTGEEISPYNHIVIGKNGNLFALSRKGVSEAFYLIAISEPDILLANSAWPMYKHDQHYSGLATDTAPPQPNIVLGRVNIDFGYVNPGTSASEFLSVYNSGLLPLEVNWILNSDVFSMDTVYKKMVSPISEATIAPGDSLQFIITFSSPETDMYCDTIFFSSNDPDQPVATVILKAKTSTEGEVKWKVQLSTYLSAPAVDDFGNIYVAGTKVWRVNHNGEIIWEYQLQNEPARGDFSNITISHNNQEIYVPDIKTVIAIDSAGNQQWIYDPPTDKRITTFAINIEDRLFFSDVDDLNGGYFYCINKEGEEVWNYYVGYDMPYPPAIDRDQNIITGGILGNQAKIISFDDGGTLNWQRDDFMPTSPLTIGFDNIIYVGGRWSSSGSYLPKVRAYRQDGSLVWTYPLPGELLSVTTSVVVGENGNLFIGAIDRIYETGILFSLDSLGNLLWLNQYSDRIYSTPAIAKNGTICFGCDDGNFYVLNPDGSEKWHVKTGAEVRSSPVIDSDGMIYFTSDDGYLYAVYGENGGLANSPWPMVQHDPKHTSAVDSLTVSIPDYKLEIFKEYSLEAMPNPFYNEVKINWIMNEPSVAIIKVYDMYLNEINNFKINCTKGVNSLIWNCNDIKDNQIKPGIYVCCLTIDGYSECIKLIKK